MDRYAVTGAQTVTATPGDTVLAVEGDATVRGKVYDVEWGSIATPADNVIQWVLRRMTALGTKTAVTPQPLDGAAPAALLAGADDHTVEPTYAAGSELLDIGVNQRASYRWVAAPESEFWVAASATDGIGLTPIGSGGGDVAATMHFVE